MQIGTEQQETCEKEVAKRKIIRHLGRGDALRGLWVWNSDSEFLWFQRENS